MDKSTTQDQRRYARTEATTQEIPLYARQLRENTAKSGGRIRRFDEVQKNRQNNALPEILTIPQKGPNPRIQMGYLRIPRMGRSGSRKRGPSKNERQKQAKQRTAAENIHRGESCQEKGERPGQTNARIQENDHNSALPEKSKMARQEPTPVTKNDIQGQKPGKSSIGGRIPTCKRTGEKQNKCRKTET